MAYCEGAPSAQIIIRVEGKRVDLRTLFPPVNYEIKRVYEPGQCPGVLYNVAVRAEARRVGTGALVGVRQSSADVFAPIRSIAAEVRAPETPNSANVMVRASKSDGTTPDATPLFGVSANLIFYTAVEVLSVTRYDGQPDECGPELGCNLRVWDTKGTLWDGTYDECATVEINCGEICCDNQETLISISGDIQRKLRELQ